MRGNLLRWGKIGGTGWGLGPELVCWEKGNRYPRNGRRGVGQASTERRNKHEKDLKGRKNFQVPKAGEDAGRASWQTASKEKGATKKVVKRRRLKITP